MHATRNHRIEEKEGDPSGEETSETARWKDLKFSRDNPWDVNNRDWHLDLKETWGYRKIFRTLPDHFWLLEMPQKNRIDIFLMKDCKSVHVQIVQNAYFTPSEILKYIEPEIWKNRRADFLRDMQLHSRCMDGRLTLNITEARHYEFVHLFTKERPWDKIYWLFCDGEFLEPRYQKDIDEFEFHNVRHFRIFPIFGKLVHQYGTQDVFKLYFDSVSYHIFGFSVKDKFYARKSFVIEHNPREMSNYYLFPTVVDFPVIFTDEKSLLFQFALGKEEDGVLGYIPLVSCRMNVEKYYAYDTTCHNKFYTYHPFPLVTDHNKFFAANTRHGLSIIIPGNAQIFSDKDFFDIQVGDIRIQTKLVVISRAQVINQATFPYPTDTDVAYLIFHSARKETFMLIDPKSCRNTTRYFDPEMSGAVYLEDAKFIQYSTDYDFVSYYRFFGPLSYSLAECRHLGDKSQLYTRPNYTYFEFTPATGLDFPFLLQPVISRKFVFYHQGHLFCYDPEKEEKVQYITSNMNSESQLNKYYVHLQSVDYSVLIDVNRYDVHLLYVDGKLFFNKKQLYIFYEEDYVNWIELILEEIQVVHVADDNTNFFKIECSGEVPTKQYKFTCMKTETIDEITRIRTCGPFEIDDKNKQIHYKGMPYIFVLEERLLFISNHKFEFFSDAEDLDFANDVLYITERRILKTRTAYWQSMVKVSNKDAHILERLFIYSTQHRTAYYVDKKKCATNSFVFTTKGEVSKIGMKGFGIAKGIERFEHQNKLLGRPSKYLARCLSDPEPGLLETIKSSQYFYDATVVPPTFNRAASGDPKDRRHTLYFERKYYEFTGLPPYNFKEILEDGITKPRNIAARPFLAVGKNDTMILLNPDSQDFVAVVMGDFLEINIKNALKIDPTHLKWARSYFKNYEMIKIKHANAIFTVMYNYVDTSVLDYRCVKGYYREPNSYSVSCDAILYDRNREIISLNGTPFIVLEGSGTFVVLSEVDPFKFYEQDRTQTIMSVYWELEITNKPARVLMNELLLEYPFEVSSIVAGYVFILLIMLVLGVKKKLLLRSLRKEMSVQLQALNPTQSSLDLQGLEEEKKSTE